MYHNITTSITALSFQILSIEDHACMLVNLSTPFSLFPLPAPFSSLHPHPSLMIRDKGGLYFQPRNMGTTRCACLIHNIDTSPNRYTPVEATKRVPCHLSTWQCPTFADIWMLREYSMPTYRNLCLIYLLYNCTHHYRVCEGRNLNIQKLFCTANATSGGSEQQCNLWYLNAWQCTQAMAKEGQHLDLMGVPSLVPRFRSGNEAGAYQIGYPCKNNFWMTSAFNWHQEPCWRTSLAVLMITTTSG